MRVILINGEINNQTFAYVDEKLNEFESDGDNFVTVRINSEGGEVYAALAIVGRLKSSRLKIVTEGYGPVMSAATLILACGNHRVMSRYAWFMHHESTVKLKGRISSVIDELEQEKREELSWAVAMAELTNQDLKFWKSKGTRTDLYLSPEQCLELKIIDEII